MTNKEKARAYYEGDPDLYATSGWLEHADIGGIVIDAFTAGAESKELSWQDVQKIVNIADEIVSDHRDSHSVLVDEKAYYTDVLRIFKLASRNSDKDLQGLTWHKTLKELPKDDSEVLVCWETANHERKYTEIAGFYRHADDWWFEDEDGQTITYKAKWWMYIPELPKED